MEKQTKSVYIGRSAVSSFIATLIAAMLILAMLFLAVGSAAIQTEGNVKDEYDALRLHIIANSNDERDQLVKLAVRDEVLNCTRQYFDAATKKDALLSLRAMGGSIQRVVEETLSKNGFEYGVQLISGSFDFPLRVYGGKEYPEGEYEALRIILGDGAGENWWCVMFPPLCIIDTCDGEIEYNEDDGTLKFESLFVRLWRSIFG